MIGKKVLEKLNYQINRELYSAYFYLGMASFSSNQGLNGVANWFNVQVQEEVSHAQKIYDYVNQQGERVVLDAIEAPPQDFSSVKDLFERTLEHEKKVTSLINDLAVCAANEKDKATEIFLQWFVTEQIEEEANASEILQRLKLIGGEGNGLFMLDNELSQRVFTPPGQEWRKGSKMEAVKVKNGIYWVGGIDWELRNFHGYLTQRGSTYNSYLIIDEKIVLVDTVKHYLFDEMLERIKTVIDPSRIDYVISNHVEMDHSGSLPMIMDICKNATVITSPQGEKGLRKHYDVGWDLKVVNTGDSLNTGERNVHFVLIPMVHWPDSMVSYIPEEKLLLPNDAFGQHIASKERFDEDFEWDIIRDEAQKYYANIVLPYGNPVKKALSAIEGLEIETIAPSHGLIWKKHIKDIIKLYGQWANDDTEEKAIIVYDTMWDSTQKMAHAVLSAFEEKGITAELCDLKEIHISDIMTKVLTAKYICVGSPTLNKTILPTVAAFLCYMKGLSPKNRKGLAFGSYGWGGQGVDEVDENLRNAGFDVMDKIKVQYIPSEAELKEVKELVKGGLL